MKFAVVVCLIAAAVTVHAQIATIDPALPPEHGSAALGVNFDPDPFRGQRIIGGGEVEISRSARGESCSGFTSAAPDFSLMLAGDLPFLRLMFVADIVTADSTLLVITPDGARLCGDNAYGVLSPVIDLQNAAAGAYLIWIGAHSSDPVYGSLYATRREDIYPNSTTVVVPPVRETPLPAGEPTPTLIPGTTLDPTAQAVYAPISLIAGFSPEPYFTFVQTSGTLDVPAFDLQADVREITFGSEVGGGSLGISGSGECAGFTTSAPTFSLTWSGFSPRLRIFFLSAPGDMNAALVVRAPDDSWWCSRDFAAESPDPLIDFADPDEGLYTIWVANETERGDPVIGALYITELSGILPDTVTLDVSVPLITPLIGLNEGSPFSTAIDLPYSTATIGGGVIDVAALNPQSGCAGFYPDAPALTLEIPVSLPFLSAVVTQVNPPESDPTLIALMPDGRWYCADDWQGQTLPMIAVFGETGIGTARFWVGSYRPDELFGATLRIAANRLSPLD